MRQPFSGMVVHYGAPSMPDQEPWSPSVPLPSAPLPDHVIDRLAGISYKRRLRISAAREGDGVRVKVTIDGVLVSETLTPGASVTVEADV